MEIKKLNLIEKYNYVEMVFVPRSISDLEMAEIIFGNIVAEQYGYEIFDLDPHFSNEEIDCMLKSKETIFIFEYVEGKYFNFKIVN